MRSALIVLLFASVASAEVTGFTIYKRPYVSPQYIAPGFLNPGPTPVYPSTFLTPVCRVKDFSIYSPKDQDRLEVWWDSRGEAESTEVTTICGTR